MPENAWIISVTGRPNAGKTTLINILTHSKLPVGKHPGTTRKISLIKMDAQPLENPHDELFILDFPGYGRLAKRSRDFSEKTKENMIEFLETNGSRIIVPIHVVDSHTFLNTVVSLEKKDIIPIDIEFVQFLNEIAKKRPLVILNKVDKLTTAREQELVTIKNSFPDCQIIETNLKDRIGLPEIHSFLQTRMRKKFQLNI